MSNARRFLQTSVERPELDALLEAAVREGVSDEQLLEQRISFAYGNAPDSPRITKESVREASKTMRLIHA